MAERSLDIKISAHDDFSNTIKKFQSSLRGAESSSTSAGQMMNQGFKLAAAGIIAATAAVVGLGYELWKAVGAANEAEAAETKLRAALGYTSQALLDQAAALQKVTTYGDETIVEAQAMIAMFVKDESQIKAATKATLDLAAAKGMDLVSAADLVAKTIGSSNNALGRYGVTVEGVTGSTERFESAINGINAAFGGQAQAQTATFGGGLKQLANVFSDVQEEIGFVITKNNFFVQGLQILIKWLGQLAEVIKENRGWLMELAKSGIMSVVDAFILAIEVTRGFSNGLNGVLMVANLVALGIEGFAEVTIAVLRKVLLPLDLIFDGLVALGQLEINPLRGLQEKFYEMGMKSAIALNQTWEGVEKNNIAFDKLKETVVGFKTELEKIQAVEIQATETRKGLADTTSVLTAEQLKAQEIIDSWINKINALGASEQELMDIEVQKLVLMRATESQIFSLTTAMENYYTKKRELSLQEQQWAAEQKLTEMESKDIYQQALIEEAGLEVLNTWQRYETKLQMMQDYNNQVIQQMVLAGASREQIEAKSAELSIQYERQVAQARLAIASSSMGMMANMMQQMYNQQGQKNKAYFTAYKAFAIAQTVIDTYKGAVAAFSAFAGMGILGIVLGAIAAAIVIAFGVMKVNQIRSMQPGGTVSSGSGSVSMPSASSIPSSSQMPGQLEKKEETKPTQNITVQIHNPLSTQNWAKIAEDNIVPALNAAQSRNINLNVRTMET